MPPPGPVLFVTWAGGGNVDPVLGLGARLAAAGRPAAVLAPPDLVDRVAAAGLTPLARDVPDPWDPAAMAADVRAAAERVGATAVVVDYMLPGALCGAEAAGLPTAALVHTLYGALLVDGAPGPMAMAASPEGIAAVRARLGLPPVDGFGGLLDRCARVLVTCPRALDRPPDPLPANVRYVGPVPEAAGPDAGWAPPAAAGGRPLVVVSLGTTPMDEAPVLRAVVDGLRAEPVHALVTLPAHLEPGVLAAPAADAVAGPGTVTVTGRLPHAAVLPHAAAVVTHAGLGTVLAALAHGLPLVCLPLGREQPENAAAVERAGAGLVLPPAATPAAVAAAVRAVLDDPAHRLAAGRMAAEIAATGDGADAVAEVAGLRSSRR